MLLLGHRNSLIWCPYYLTFLLIILNIELITVYKLFKVIESTNNDTKLQKNLNFLIQRDMNTKYDSMLERVRLIFGHRGSA